MNRTYIGLVRTGMAAAAYAASAPLLAWALSLRGASCTYSMMQTHCTLGAPASYDPVVYGSLALSVVAMLAIARLRAHDRPWYPLIATFSLLVLAVIAYDTLAGRDVVDGEKLANDTFNTLRFAMLASFLLLFRLMRGMSAGLLGTAGAVAASYAAVIVAALAFHDLADDLIGATKLFVLFVVYAFGGFGIHIMTICTLFSSSRIEDEGGETVALTEIAL
jgi:hypothetical protein